MRNRLGIVHVDEIYVENAESVEAVVPPGRDVRITKGRGAIRAKREDWVTTHGIHRLDADGPHVQRVTIDNQILGLVVVFGVRLPRPIPRAFKDATLKVSNCVPGLHAALHGLFAVREAILAAVSAIDSDVKKIARMSGTCARLMTVPGVGPITALAFADAVVTTMKSLPSNR